MNAPIIVDCVGGRLIINALPGTNQVSITVDCGRGTMGVICSPMDAVEVNLGIVSAIKAAVRPKGD